MEASHRGWRTRSRKILGDSAFRRRTSLVPRCSATADIPNTSAAPRPAATAVGVDNSRPALARGLGREACREQAVKTGEVSLQAGWKRQPGGKDDIVPAPDDRIDDRLGGRLGAH